MTAKRQEFWANINASQSRLLRAVGLVIAALLLVVIGITTLLSFPAGRTFVVSQALSYVGSTIGQRIAAGQIGGALPSHIILSDVTVADGDGVWLTADTFEIRLRADALLLGHVHVENLDVGAARVIRLPSQSGPGREGIKLPAALELFKALSSFTVENATVDSLLLDETALGYRADVEFQASLTPNNERGGIYIAATLDRRDDPGSAKLSLRAEPTETALSLQGSLAGVDVKGDVALKDTDILSGTFDVRCRAVPCVALSEGGIRSGFAILTLSGTASAPTAQAEFSLAELSYGSRLLSSISGQATLDSPPDESGALAISAKGFIQGAKEALPELADIIRDEGSWSVKALVNGDNAAVQDARLDLGDLAVTVIGVANPSGIAPANIDITIRGAGRLLDMAEDVSILRATFDATHINGAGDIRGELTIDVADTLKLPPLLDGVVKVNATVASDGQELSFSGISVSSGVLALQGVSIWNRLDGRIGHLSSEFTLTADGGALGGVLPQSTRAALALTGPLSELKAQLNASTPEVALGAASFIEPVLLAELSRSGDAMAGALEISGEWLGIPFFASAATVRADTNSIALSDFNFTGGAGEIAGQLSVNLSDGLLRGDLAGRFADLLPLTTALGFSTEGGSDVTASLFASDGMQSADFGVEADDVTTSLFGASALSAHAKLGDLWGVPQFTGNANAVSAELMGGFADTMTVTAQGSYDNFHVALAAPATGSQTFALDVDTTVSIGADTAIVIHHLAAQDGPVKGALIMPTRLVIADDRITLEPTTFDFAGGAVEADFHWDRLTKGITGEFVARGVSAATIMNEPESTILGIIDAKLSLSGLADAVIVDASLDGHFPAPSGIASPPIGVTLHAALRDGQASITGAATGLSDQPARLTARFPMHFDLEAARLAIDVDAPLSGSLTWNGDLVPLWRLLPIDDHILSGAVSLNTSVTGSLAAPQIKGGLHLTNGAYEYLPGGTILENLDIDVVAENSDTFTFTLSASDSDVGTITADGRIGRGRSAESWSSDISAQLNRLALVNRDDVTLGATGSLAYTGPLLSGTLGGQLQVVRSAVRLDASYAPEIPLLRTPGGVDGTFADAKIGDKTSAITLDVTLKIDDVLRAEGRGLESTWRGQIHVGGDIVHPDLAGTIAVDRGTFSFLGQTFRLDSGTVTFTGGDKVDPELAITAVREAEDITATVLISGRASRPNIELSSRPPLPQDEVLARLLFRKGSGQLGPLESVQLASAVADLSGLSDGGLNGMLRRTLGLDVISVGGEDGDSLVVGEQIGRNVYVAVEQNLTDNTRKFIVEWRFSPAISLQSTASDNTGADLGILWRRDY